MIRSEAVCESAASILNQHIHDNRSLDHESLDEGVMLHRNAPSLYLADPFVKSSSSNKGFFQLKDKHWIFFKKQLGEIFDFLEDSAPLPHPHIHLLPVFSHSTFTSSTLSCFSVFSVNLRSTIYSRNPVIQKTLTDTKIMIIMLRMSSRYFQCFSHIYPELKLRT